MANDPAKRAELEKELIRLENWGGYAALASLKDTSDDGLIKYGSLGQNDRVMACLVALVEKLAPALSAVSMYRDKLHEQSKSGATSPLRKTK